MTRMALRVVQLNYQRSYAVMNDLSAVLVDECCVVAGVYVSKERVCGLVGIRPCCM